MKKKTNNKTRQDFVNDFAKVFDGNTECGETMCDFLDLFADLFRRN